MQYELKYIDSIHPQYITRHRFLWRTWEKSYTRFKYEGRVYWINDITDTIHHLTEPWIDILEQMLKHALIKSAYKKRKQEIERFRV